MNLPILFLGQKGSILSYFILFYYIYVIFCSIRL